jgi:hypothetical protein
MQLLVIQGGAERRKTAGCTTASLPRFMTGLCYKNIITTEGKRIQDRGTNIPQNISHSEHSSLI